LYPRGEAWSLGFPGKIPQIIPWHGFKKLLAIFSPGKTKNI